jgi:putative spermidine/putrescine transport system permease protein
MNNSAILSGGWKEKRGALFRAAVVLPPVALVCVEYVYPFLLSLQSSFQKDGRTSAANYAYALSVYGQDVLFTVYVCFLSLALVLFLSVVIGGFLTLHRNRFLEFVFKIPLFIPFVVVGHAMRTYLAPKGLLDSLLSQIGVIDINNPPNFIYGAVGIVIALTWKQLSFALLLVMSAFQSVDRSYLEASRILGAGTFRQIRDFLIPLSKSSIGVTAVLLLTSFLQNFSVVMMMGDSGGSQHIMVDIYSIITYLNDLPLANALGVISYLLALGPAILYLTEGMKQHE